MFRRSLRVATNSGPHDFGEVSRRLPGPRLHDEPEPRARLRLERLQGPPPARGRGHELHRAPPLRPPPRPLLRRDGLRGPPRGQARAPEGRDARRGPRGLGASPLLPPRSRPLARRVAPPPAAGATATAAVQLLAVFNSGGRPLFGRLADTYGPKRTLLVMYAVLLGAMG